MVGHWMLVVGDLNHILGGSLRMILVVGDFDDAGDGSLGRRM